MSDPAVPSAALPPSATHPSTAWSCFATMLAAITLINFWQPFAEIAHLALIVLAAAALGAFVPDLLWHKVHRRALLATPQPGSRPRTGIKFLGLCGAVAGIAALYALFPEYQQPFYRNYWSAARVVLPAWALLAVPYLYWVDRRMAEPCDGLWQAGCLLIGRWHGLEPRRLGQFALGWLVKAFFVPLMFVDCCDGLRQLLHYDLNRLTSFRGLYDWGFFTLYCLDVTLVSMTYLMSLRATDTHIRSSEPTTLGWIVALACYQPFWSLLERQYLHYDNGHPWGEWLAATPWLYRLWGCLILALVSLYLWATVAFGARFSNLTHRGIITAGPYRLTKHPAYLAKNLSWWLISVPFLVSTGVLDSVRRCGLLLLVNAIYYLRAKTEERHLALDPVYLEYARWIDAHGVLRFVNRIPLVGDLARWRPRFYLL